MRTLEEFNGYYADKPRTCFIVGAGTSIKDQDLSPLRDFVTIAVNSGYVAVPFADFFVSDDWATSKWSYFLHDLYYSKNTIALLYADKLQRLGQIFGDREVIFRHRTWYNLTDTYKHKEYALRVCQCRTSIGSAIHIAYIMGCTEIVLLGVDCCRAEDKRYFWQFKENQPFRVDKASIDPFYIVKLGIYQSDSDLVDILSFWETMGSNFLEKCQIYNASPISMLSIFPKVDLEDFIGAKGKKK